MRNDAQGEKNISIYPTKGYGMAKYFSSRTLNPASKNLRFLAKIQGGQIHIIVL